MSNERAGHYNLHVDMLSNYLLIARRVFRKHFFYSAINILGLALGLLVVLLIALFVRFELSFDRFHEKADRTVRIVQQQPENMYLGSNEFAVTPVPLEDALRDDLAYVETATQINDMRALVTVEGQRGFFGQGLFATPPFLDVFDFELLRGDPSTALDEPYSVLITPEFADKVFDSQDVIGRRFELVYYQSTYDVAVSGLVEAPPPNAHFDFSFVMSYVGHPSRENASWGSNSLYTYAVLTPGTPISRLNADLADMVDRNMSELSWIVDNPNRLPRYYAQPLTDIHLRSHINFEIADNGDIRYLWLFLLAAGLIMLTACINYMNLATARAGLRSKEVGIRKVSGADRGQLARQFLGESVFTALSACVLAVIATWALLPAFNQLVGREIPAASIASVWFIGLVPMAGVVIGLISGSYPAVFLSRLVPVDVLKSGSTMRASRSRLRNLLVVVQFAIGIVLVIGAIVIQGQLDFIRTADTGMDRDHVVTVRVRDQDLAGKWDIIQDEVSRVPGVESVSASNHMPTNISSSNGVDDWEGHEEGQNMSFYTSGVNYGFFEMLELDFVEGRGFSEEFGADEGMGLVINETAMRELGWESAVGKHLDLGDRGSEVVGVVEDFRFHSFHQEVRPMALYLDTDVTSQILIQVRPDDIPATVAGITDVFFRLSPTYPLEYQFLDDAYDALYRSEQRLGLVLKTITGLALLIACLGLFGLAAFLTLQRTKEIGVRKALGAGIGDILLLLSKDFGRLILVAFVVGAPVAWIAATRWLDAYAFHIDVGPMIFVYAGLFIAGVTLVTVGYQSVKAALTDPVRALRHE